MTRTLLTAIFLTLFSQTAWGSVQKKTVTCFGLGEFFDVKISEYAIEIPRIKDAFAIMHRGDIAIYAKGLGFGQLLVFDEVQKEMVIYNLIDKRVLFSAKCK